MRSSSPYFLFESGVGLVRVCSFSRSTFIRDTHSDVNVRFRAEQDLIDQNLSVNLSFVSLKPKYLGFRFGLGAQVVMVTVTAAVFDWFLCICLVLFLRTFRESNVSGRLNSVIVPLSFLIRDGRPFCYASVPVQRFEVGSSESRRSGRRPSFWPGFRRRLRRRRRLDRVCWSWTRE